MTDEEEEEEAEKKKEEDKAEKNIFSHEEGRGPHDGREDRGPLQKTGKEVKPKANVSAPARHSQQT